MRTITSARLTLRALADGDADFLRRLFSAPTVLRYLPPEAEIATDDQARERLERLRAAGQFPFGFNAVVETATSRTVGLAILRDWPSAEQPHGRVEVGWHVHPDHGSRGYATEALHALIEATSAQVTDLWAFTVAGNGASRRVAEKLSLLCVESPTDNPYGGGYVAYHRDIRA